MDKVTILDDEGKEKEVNLITIFSLKEFSSAYLVYMEDEIYDKNNTLCFAKIIEKNGKMFLDNITAPEEVKAVQKEFERMALK